MNKLIARLIDCGLSRETALAICRRYRREGRMKELERYVEEVEDESRVALDDV